MNRYFISVTKQRKGAPGFKNQPALSVVNVGLDLEDIEIEALKFAIDRPEILPALSAFMKALDEAAVREQNRILFGV